MSNGDKLYSDREVRKILERAIEIQKTETRETIRGGDLSLDDLRHIAAETGINPDLVGRAAREVETGEANRRARGFFGAETKISASGVIRREVSEEELKSLLPMMQGIVGTAGTGTVHRGSFSWGTVAQTPNNSGITTAVSVRASGGRTEVVIEERLGAVAGGVFGGLVGGFGLGTGLGVGLGVGLGAMGSAVFSVIFPLGVIGGAYLVARTIFKAVVRGRKRDMNRVLDKILGFFESDSQSEAVRDELR